MKQFILHSIPILIMAICLMGILIGCEERKQEVIAEEKQPTNLVIETPEKCTDGIITVYEKDGFVNYQINIKDGNGKINIINDGKDGNPVEIEVQTDITWDR